MLTLVKLTLVSSLLLSSQLFAADRVTISKKSAKKEALSLIKKVSGKSKFAFTADHNLVISITGKKKPNHGKLRGDKKALSAGYIELKWDGDKISSVYLDNRSGHVCPTYESLASVFSFLVEKLGVQSQVQLTYNPNLKKCNK